MYVWFFYVSINYFYKTKHAANLWPSCWTPGHLFPRNEIHVYEEASAWILKAALLLTAHTGKLIPFNRWADWTGRSIPWNTNQQSRERHWGCLNQFTQLNQFNQQTIMMREKPTLQNDISCELIYTTFSRCQKLWRRRTDWWLPRAKDGVGAGGKGCSVNGERMMCCVLTASGSGSQQMLPLKEPG